jgi:hypothetical protein
MGAVRGTDAVVAGLFWSSSQKPDPGTGFLRDGFAARHGLGLPRRAVPYGSPTQRASNPPAGARRTAGPAGPGPGPDVPPEGDGDHCG